MSGTKIKALAIADYLGRDNINPFRPEAAQLIGLQRSGKVDVTVMCSPESVLVDYYRDVGIRVITHKIRKKVSLETIRFIRRQVREQGFDILHLFHSRAISNGILSAMGLPVKVVVYRGQTGSLGRYDPISYLSALNPRVDKIICVSKSVETYLRKQIWGNTDKPVTIYKGHDLAWYQNESADLTSADLPPDAFKVAMVANLRPRKGLHVLVAATHHLPADAPIYFLLMGANTNDREVQAMINTAARPERFRCLGYRNDAPEVAAACDLVILPTTKREGLSRAVVEAMAYGRPAVVSDTGGNAELVANGESGIVVPAGDAFALANGITELWSDPEKRQRYGEEAKRRIRDIFSAEQGIEKTLQVYLELVDRPTN